MAPPVAYSRRRFVGGAVKRLLQTTESDVGALAFTADATLTGWPAGAGASFLMVMNRSQSNEEKMWVASVAGTGITIVAGGRGADGTTAIAHNAGETIELCIGAVDADEANYAVSKTVGQITAVGDLLVGDAAGSLDNLAKGTDGFPLVVNSAVALDLEYARLTATGLASSVAGNGLAGGAGTALSVNVDDVGIEINTDALRLKALGVTAAKLNADVAGNGLTGGGGSALAVNPDGVGLEISTDILRLKDLGVVTAKINDLGVTGAKIANATITGGKLVNDTITSTQIGPDAVGQSELGPLSAGTPELIDAGVTLAKMANIAESDVIVGNAGGGVPVYRALGRSWAKKMEADSIAVDTTPTQITSLDLDNVAMKTGRRYKLEFCAPMGVTTGSGIGFVGFRRGGTAFSKYLTSELTSVAFPGQTFHTFYEPGSDEAEDWSIWLESNSGAYNVRIKASGTEEATFIITDIGWAINL